MTTGIIHGARLMELLREQVLEAFTKEEIRASVEAEYYLVSLLHDFHSAELAVERDRFEAFEKPLAILLLDAMSDEEPKKIRGLKKIGDQALVLVGFFGERIRRTIVDPSYYEKMGCSAYSHLSNLFARDDALSELYSELAGKFSEFTRVLTHVAPWNRATTNTDILHIYERWLTTGDEKLQEVLEKEGISTK